MKDKLSMLVDRLKKGLEEMACSDGQCIYPLCDNCGECYFRDALKIAEELKEEV